MSVDVRLAALDGIAERLSRASADLGATGSGVPTGVDAGPAAGELAAALQRLVENAANLCEGLELAAAAVERSRDAYARSDDGAAERFFAPGV